ncbi:MAG: hypothetical protein PVF43_00760 [Candidatus Eiseniibacteriota bacterium]|jgi:Icc-related predicted phosphoesterase
MTRCLFASDLHGQVELYRKLLDAIRAERPAAVFLGGDLLPTLLEMTGATGLTVDPGNFVHGFLGQALDALRQELGPAYPRIFVIMGNDDPRTEESSFLDLAASGLWTYVQDRVVPLGRYRVHGYAYVPPTPFQLKDWERYDVSRYVDPGCVSPEAGQRSVPEAAHVTRYATIQADLDSLAGDASQDNAVYLFHSPPYRTRLDRAALDGRLIDHVPVDVHVGSIAIARFIDARQPLVTLHGHVHESARLTGSWRDRRGRTELFSAAHDGPELALIRFTLEDLPAASRDLL